LIPNSSSVGLNSCNKKLPVQAAFVSASYATTKGSEILEESVDQDSSNHEQAYPDKRKMDENRFDM